MKLKQRIKFIIHAILFLLIFFLILKQLGKVLERKESIRQHGDFFEQEENFDVLFFGTSHVINGIFPMELWNRYGLVSYNFGGWMNQIATSYWVLKNALDYTMPKLVVIDVHMVQNNIKTSENLEFLHRSLDCFPISVTKYQMIRDLFDDEDAEGYESRWEFFWDFGAYHSRWNDLTRGDFFVDTELEKGADSIIGIAKPEAYDRIGPEYRNDEESVGKKYLRKIIEECQKRGIDVLLINLPYPADVEEQKAANSIYDIADEYQIEYLNLMQVDDIIDDDIDWYDKSGHLNAAGGKKVTEYLGQYIMKHYDIEDHRGNAAYEFWNDDYLKYVEQKIQCLKEADELSVYLMLLHDDDLSCKLYVREGARCYDDVVIQKLIDNITFIDEFFVFSDGDEMREELESMDGYDIRVVVMRRDTNELVDERIF